MGKARGLKMGKDNVENYDCQQLSDYLLSSGIREEVTEAFQANINREAFLYLSEEDLKELLPVIGNRILIRKLLKKLHEVVINVLTWVFVCNHAETSACMRVRG